MSALKTKLVEDMKQAMRDRNSVKLNTVRFLLSELKNFEIDNGEQDDAGVTKIIAREVKKMKDANIEFQAGGRQDLVDEELVKIAILEEYLPQQLSAEELTTIVQQTIAELDKKDFGTVMKTVMAKVSGRADGNAVSTAVKAALA